MLSADSRVSYVTTSTSGFNDTSVFFAESTLRSPTRSRLWRIWRCRLEASTSSMSTMPIVPTPAAARYSAAGEPSPPAPSSRTLEASSFAWPSVPTSGSSR